MTNPIAQNEYYVVDISGLKDVCGFGFDEAFFTMPMPNDDYIFAQIKTSFDNYISQFSEFKNSTELITEFSSDMFPQFRVR